MDDKTADTGVFKREGETAQVKLSHKAIVGEAFPDLEASTISDEHYQLFCATMPCRCTCRCCLIRSLQYYERQHLTTPKS